MKWKQWWLDLKKPANLIWLQPAAAALFALLYIGLTVFATKFLPPDIFPNIDTKTLDSLLTIIASSMLAISTFSLSIMVSAFASAGSGATPRATELVMGDNGTRLAISSFIASFIYAIITKSALGISVFGQNGRFLFFISTVAVILYLIVVLIHWVQVISRLGRTGDTIRKIYAKAASVLRAYRSDPNNGANWRPSPEEAPLYTVTAQMTGDLARIMHESLQKFAEAHRVRLFITVRTGNFIRHDTNLLQVYPDSLAPERQPLTQDDVAALRSCFAVQTRRDYDQDPRFGLSVVSEVGQKALSPAINDPGTGVITLTVLARLLCDETADAPAERNFDRLGIIPLPEEDFVRETFGPLIYSGNNNLVIYRHALLALSAVAAHAPEETVRKTARVEARHALQRGLVMIADRGDRLELQRTYTSLFGTVDIHVD